MFIVTSNEKKKKLIAILSSIGFCAYPDTKSLTHCKLWQSI